MATATKPRPTDELKCHCNEVAKEMNKEPWKPKLQDAMDFVLTGAVDLDACTVRSGAHHYQFDDEYGCTCSDARLRNHRYCKHFVAVEMQRRVDARMKGGDMPAKNKQTEWEATVQNENGEAEPALFDKEPEPDDIADPEVPKKLKATAKLTPEGQAMVERGELNVGDAVDLRLISRPTHTEEQRVSVQGHQYSDYPSTLNLARRIRGTEVSWTFRGTDDDDVWERAKRKLAVLQKAADQYEAEQSPPPQQTPQQQAPPPQQPQAPAQATYAETAAGSVPICPVHQRTMKPSQYGGFYCTVKNPDNSYCKTKA